MLEIICVGNELLIGKTLNTNAHWLAKRATSLGVMVERVTVILDEVDEIATVLNEALKRKPRFIITTGGLGPTFDDKTLEGIARGLSRKLAVNKKALEMVREKYEGYLKQNKVEKVDLTPARVKMATLPEGAEPLHNAVGTAPGMLLRVDGTFIVALPGVPPEMETIFDESVAPIIKKEAGNSGFFEKSIYADNIMESNLAPLIDKVMHDNPGVYIKSHPRGKENKPHIELHFSATTTENEKPQERIQRAADQITRLITKSKGKVFNEK